MIKICIIFGTRPEIIKMSPLIEECKRLGLNFFVIHTNQHYSPEMDKVFFEDLNISSPDYNLGIGSGNHGEMTGKMLIKIEEILRNEKPNIVLVEGDTNTVLAGALAASKLNIKVGHIEAGLRSYDRGMPEEINRVMVDHISDFLFVPTKESKYNLLKEGLNEEKIFIVGNTVVDAVFRNLEIANKRNSVLDKFNLNSNDYALLTLHRPANVDNREIFESIIRGIAKLESLGIKKILFFIHPRTENRISVFNLQLPPNIIKMGPVGYFEMLKFLDNAKIILTDSGGLQEEACILNTPCVTLRDNTERPETLAVGANILTGSDEKLILKGVEEMLFKKREWNNPFGDGMSSKKILTIILETL